MNLIKRLDIFGCVSFSAYLYLAIISQYHVTEKLIPFFSVNAITWLCLWGILYSIKHENADLMNKENKKLIYHIFFWSILFQLPGLFCDPLLDDDYFRYLWDGYVFATTGNPYTSAPASFFSISLPNEIEAILNRINYPDIPTIYGPVCQYLFLIANYFKPHQVFILKSLLLCSNIMSTWIILKLARFKYVIFFAWCPLLIIQSVFELHIDAVGMFFLLAAIYLYRSTDFLIEKDSGKAIGTMLFSSLAIATKIIAAPIVFIMLLRYPLKYWFYLVMMLAFLYLPFLMSGQDFNPYKINMFFSGWMFNASLYEFFQYVIGPKAAHKLSMGWFAVLLISILLVQEKYKQNIPRGDIILGVLFLLSPVVNPWYLVWLLPFASLYPARWSLAALVMVSFSYINGYYLANDYVAPYQIPFSIQLIEYGVVFLALIEDMRKKSFLKVI